MPPATAVIFGRRLVFAPLGTAADPCESDRKTVSLDLSIADGLSPLSGDPSGLGGMGPECARSGAASAPQEAAADSAEGLLVEFHRAEGEFEDFFDEMFERLHSLSMDLLGRQRSLDLAARRQAEESKAVAECRRQFRLSLDELQQVHAEARDSRDENRRVWAEVRTAQEQSLRMYAAMREAQAALTEELRRVRTFLLGSSGPSSEQPGADTAVAAGLNTH
jgi:hypothetical protein